MIVLSFAAGIAIERVLFKPLANAPILSQLVGFIACSASSTASAGQIWDYTIKTFPTPVRLQAASSAAS